ncbi:phage tail sheath C-terminal domain-containing protein [Dysosmobacter sp.]|uniref:phage tail sheath C-terminal domain-containing protein n=1 Tax=Dysosmobacter sp. TaxID=2591382 RepID=UPI003AB3658A
MGLPEIFISFQTAAVSAITRSARGVLAVAVKDATEGGATEAAYKSLAEVPEDKFSSENYRLLKLAFLAAPTKVWVLRVGEDAEKTYQALERLRFDWLAAPGLDDARVMSFIKTLRSGGRGVKAVVANATAPDCEGIVNLCVSGLTLEDGAIEAKDYAVRVAALLAALPLTRSATYVNLPEVVGCDALAEPDADVDAGKLIIVPGREGYRLGRAVNSLTTLTPDKAAPFQKIKIVEGIDLIRGDIAKAFESGYVGKVLNDYDNKLLLVTAINTYLKGLEGDVLDKTADNRCFVSLSGQRSYLESRGTDTSEMKDTDILKANTGSQVFLEAKLTFCDAMEDLALVISM